MTPKEECESLMGELLPVGVKLLRKYKEFYPFAGIIKSDGTFMLMGFYDGEVKPNVKEYSEKLISACRDFVVKNKANASGIVSNASIIVENREKDAIIVSLEHKEGYCAQVALPYKRMLFGIYKFYRLTAVQGKHNIFIYTKGT